MQWNFILVGSATARLGLTLLSVPIVLLGYRARQKLNASQHLLLWGLLAALILSSSITLVRIATANIDRPPEWDFLSFWLNGKVAARGLNFYEPAHAQILARPFHPSAEFTREILNVGFWYPPPSMFLFLPLGWLDLRAALLVWYVAQGICLGLSIVLLWQIFFAGGSLLGLASIAALVLMLFGTQLNVTLGQTIFLALLMLLLFWRDRSTRRGGIWLAIGIFTKPFFALLLCYLVLRRYWQALSSAVLALVACALLAIAAFGPVTFFSYFKASPYAKIPSSVYAEPINQSLLSAILRLTQHDFSRASPLTQPAFALLALALAGISGWSIYRLRPCHDDWALAIALALSLLLYPASLAFYSTLLIVPLLLLWTQHQEFPFGKGGVAAWIALQYGLMSYGSGNYTFFATATIWLAQVGIAFATFSKKPLNEGDRLTG